MPNLANCDGVRAEENTATFILEKVLRESPTTYYQFIDVQRFVSRMWQLFDLGKHTFVPTCHHVVRLVKANVLGLTVVDGHFKKGYQHSWLHGTDPAYIIDPYPVLALNGPLLIDVGAPVSPWKDLYDASTIPSAIERPEFLDDVADFILWFERATMAFAVP